MQAKRCYNSSVLLLFQLKAYVPLFAQLKPQGLICPSRRSITLLARHLNCASCAHTIVLASCNLRVFDDRLCERRCGSDAATTTTTTDIRAVKKVVAEMRSMSNQVAGISEDQFGTVVSGRRAARKNICWSAL